MKNLLSKVYHILILFVIPLTFVIATAGTCDGFEVGGGERDARRNAVDAYAERRGVGCAPDAYAEYCAESVHDMFC